MNELLPFFAFWFGIILTASVSYSLHLRHCRKREEELADDLFEAREFQRMKENVLNEIALNGYAYIEDQDLNLYIIAKHPINGSGREC